MKLKRVAKLGVFFVDGQSMIPCDSEIPPRQEMERMVRRIYGSGLEIFGDIWRWVCWISEMLNSINTQLGCL